MFDDFSIGNSVSFGDFLKCSLRIFRVPTIIHHISVPPKTPTKKHGAFGTPAMMVKPNASERVKIKRLKCWMKYWTLACIKPSDKTRHRHQSIGNFVAAKNNAKQIMGSYGIHGCLLISGYPISLTLCFLNVESSRICEFDQGATLMTNTKPGRKSPHPLLSGNSAFVSFMRKNSCRFQSK